MNLKPLAELRDYIIKNGEKNQKSSKSAIALDKMVNDAINNRFQSGEEYLEEEFLIDYGIGDFEHDTFTNIAIHQFGKIAAADYIFQVPDRNRSNIMVKYNQLGKIVNLSAIDMEFSFMFKFPIKINGLKFQFNHVYDLVSRITQNQQKEFYDGVNETIRLVGENIGNIILLIGSYSFLAKCADIQKIQEYLDRIPQSPKVLFQKIQEINSDVAELHTPQYILTDNPSILFPI